MCGHPLWMKTPENELKNVFVNKLNPQSRKIYKTTLHLPRPIFSRKLQICVTYMTSYELHHLRNICYLRFFQIAKSQRFIVYGWLCQKMKFQSNLNNLANFIIFWKNTAKCPVTYVTKCMTDVILKTISIKHKVVNSK